MHHFHDCHVILVGEKTWLPRNWRAYFGFGKELGPSCGLVELFFIILQLQIHKHHDQVLQYQNGSNAARGSLRLKVTF